MRAFCAILLMGIVTYVHAANSHHCDSLAMDLGAEGQTSGQSSGPDNEDEKFNENKERLPLSKFLELKESWFYVTLATPNGLPDANNVCSGATHGDECGGVEYKSEIKGTYEVGRKEQLKGIQMESTFIGYNFQKKEAFKFTMAVEIVDKDDYIFKHVDNTEIAVEPLGSTPSSGDGGKITGDISDILKSEFALFSIKGGHVYVTCDGKYAWIAQRYGEIQPGNLDNILFKLKQIVKKQKDNYDIQLKYNNNPRMPHPFTQIFPDYGVTVA